MIPTYYRHQDKPQLLPLPDHDKDAGKNLKIPSNSNYSRNVDKRPLTFGKIHHNTK